MATKRSLTQLETANNEGQAFSKAAVLEKGKAAPRRSIGGPSELDPEMGEFEDEWEDEIDDGEGVVVDAKEHLEGLEDDGT
ncbi:hypothetical protein FRC02_002118 [Tulasnella sp. 418]|nr:hypothetical protein FRC02_002118 [Tulasnella sp. 418]